MTPAVADGPTPDAQRCPRCGAVARGGDWCWLCQADLRTVPGSGRPPRDTHGEPAAFDVVTGRAPGAAAAGPPSAAPPSPNQRVDLPPPTGAVDVGGAEREGEGSEPGGADVEAMLAALRAQEAGGLERVAERVPDRGRRLLLSGAAVVLVVLVLLLVATVLGGLLR